MAGTRSQSRPAAGGQSRSALFLDIVLADPQTLQIVMRHASTMNREQVRKAIEAAKETIRTTARGYGWDKWVKIRENVEMYAAKKERTGH